MILIFFLFFVPKNKRRINQNNPKARWLTEKNTHKKCKKSKKNFFLLLFVPSSPASHIWLWRRRKSEPRNSETNLSRSVVVFSSLTSCCFAAASTDITWRDDNARSVWYCGGKAHNHLATENLKFDFCSYDSNATTPILVVMLLLW